MSEVERRRPPAGAGRLESLLAAKEIVITCGSGGVGKTTIAAAAAAMAATRQGGRVLVLTVDPAKRLATALGLEGFGNEAARVPDASFKAAGVQPRGELWAAMLDTKQSWDELVRRHAPDARTAEQILTNKLYANISGRFVQSHEYIAMERLYELHQSGRYDLIVVDTPPTRNALDFLEAPDRMADFFSSRFLKLLSAPSRNRLFSAASRPFYLVADRILGSQFLSDIAEFFALFERMGPGFVQRARAVERVLHDRRTTFVVVTTLEAAPVHEAEFFLRSLNEMGFHLGAVVLNKALPGWLLAEAPARLAERLREEVDSAVAALVPAGGPSSASGAGGPSSASGAGGLSSASGAGGLDAEPAQVRRVLCEVADAFLNYQVVAQREAEEKAELASGPDVLVTVPAFDQDIHDLAGVLRLGEALFTDG